VKEVKKMEKYKATPQYGAKNQPHPALASYGIKNMPQTNKAGNESADPDAIVELAMALGEQMQGLVGKLPGQESQNRYALPKEHYGPSATQGKGTPNANGYGQGVILMYFGNQEGNNYMIVAQYNNPSQKPKDAYKVH
jgi:hypothetical protein